MDEETETQNNGGLAQDHSDDNWQHHTFHSFPSPPSGCFSSSVLLPSLCHMWSLLTLLGTLVVWLCAMLGWGMRILYQALGSVVAPFSPETEKGQKCASTGLLELQYVPLECQIPCFSGICQIDQPGWSLLWAQTHPTPLCRRLPCYSFNL